LSLEGLLRRDRFVIGGALFAIVALAWIYLLGTPRTMQMTGMTMPDTPEVVMSMAWSGPDFLLMFLMWTVMMVGMMTPSAAPMILVYARVANQPGLQGPAFASSAWFAAGYLLSWTAFSLAATVAQYALDRAALLTLGMYFANTRIAGIVLMAAGAYQWTSLKDSCLKQCRSPLAFIQEHGGFRKTISGGLSLGFRHGLYCIGCCWGLMVLLFAGGVMNILWIAAIAILVLIEKVLPAGRTLGRIAGAGMVLWGLWLLFRPVFRV
jgi:predicted metal-binding membrane protein